MKKAISAALSFLMLFFLCSCSQEIQNSTNASTSESSVFMQTTQPVTTVQTTATTRPAETSAQTTAAAPQTTAQTTAPATSTVTTSTATTEQEEQNYCTVTIDCKTIKSNMSSLKKGLEGFVTKNGYILKDAKVELSDGDTAFDIIKKACKENVCTDNCKYCQNGGIQIEYSYTPAYESYYIEGIHQLYEKSCGSMSGWLYSVNGEYPQVSSSVYEVKSGDSIALRFTCDGGDDVGNVYVG